MNVWKLIPKIFLPCVFAVLSTHSLALTPNGTAIYNEFGKQVYLGTLFLDTPSKSASEILGSSQRKRIELRFSSEMSTRRWSQTWTQSMAINSPRETMVSAADDLSETLSAFQSGLEAGDTVIIDYDPVSGTSVSVNGVPLVEKKSPALFSLFLASWIGPVPPGSQFKNAILGATDSAQAYAAFQALTPAPARVEAVKNWSTKLKEEQERALAEAEAEEEAVKKAEEEAKKKAETEALQEQQRLALIEEEKLKAQEAARKAAQEAAVAREAAEKEQAAENTTEGGGNDLSVDSILAQQEYAAKVISQIYKSVKYPGTAVKRNQEGSVRANIVIDRGGNLKNITLVDESEFSSLNTAVVNAVNDAAPFPAIPEKVQGESLELTVPVAFKLN